jgi:S-adenosylmethionine:tRNA ribosyltransferase-isomerase
MQLDQLPPRDALPLSLRLVDFDFDLPQALIARHPASPRDSARLLVVGAGLEDRRVSDLPAVLRAGDMLILNDTKVIPAQLAGWREGRTGGPDVAIGVTLHQQAAPDTWRAFARPAKRLALGDRIRFADDFSAAVLGKNAEGQVTLRFDVGGSTLSAALRRHGSMPLPPYIRKLRSVEPRDAADYQTVYARREGAVAAPTAGLHFTPALLAALAGRGIEQVRLTLHVGAGTFLPVKTERIEDHRMHAEYGEISADAAAAINRARAEGRRLVAVGTTTLRLLEAAADNAGAIGEFAGETEIFITPGYRFRTADLLMTNFHLPKSTLFMLVAAFAGLARMKSAYAHAIATGYRFFSYGDASLLELGK